MLIRKVESINVVCNDLVNPKSSTAAIIRIGLVELHDFCREFFPSTKSETFLMESCGIADIITSCNTF
jgi:glycerol-3-phosphate dehydrogenase